MGYRIVYGPVLHKQINRNKSPGRIRYLTAFSFFILAVTVRLLWPEATEILREYLLPGDLSLAEEAFSALLYQIRNGEGLRDAALVFCRTILYEGS